MSFRVSFHRTLLCFFLTVSSLSAIAAESLVLLPKAEVDAQGVFLEHVATHANRELLANVFLIDSPAFRSPRTLPRAEIARLIAKASPKLASLPISGAETIQIARRERKLDGKELIKLLTDKLQPGQEREQREGDDSLELRFTRDWTPISVPTDPIELRIVGQPANLSANFIVRFEIQSGEETIGTFSASLQARMFRTVWVARSVIKRGTRLDIADLVQEKRDVLSLSQREPIWSGLELDPSSQIAENIAAGGVVYARHVKERPIVLRGQYAEAVVKDKLMRLSTRVEILEDGAKGQIVRARNLRTKKEVRGRVINEDTIEIAF